MTALQAARLDTFTAPARPSTPRIWGFDAVPLHDAYWETRQCSVVRRGSGLPCPQDQFRYLLIDPDILVVFEPPARQREVSGRHRAACVIEVVEFEDTAYSERVECDDHDQFIGIRRHYVPRIRATTVVAITSNAAMARAWSETSNGHVAGMNLLRAQGWRASGARIRCKGRCLDAGNRDEHMRFFTALLAQARSVSDDSSEVRTHSDGVLAHHTAVISPQATLIGPAWIGAGRILVDGDVLVGPCVLEDIGTAAPVSNSGLIRSWLRSEPSAERHTKRLPVEARLDRAFNIGLGFLAFLLTLPLYPLIMLVIWLEDGWPFFFCHARQTRGGREFGCLKFRTMCRDAERFKAKLDSENASDGPQFHMPDDPRLLRVGHWLRRFHLDELPQFINVIRGEMNLVGPRPSPDRENQYCPSWREARLSVNPGITGLWQVCRTRRPHIDFQEWIRFDMEYVRRRSWRLDAWIIWKTIWKVAVRRRSE